MPWKIWSVLGFAMGLGLGCTTAAVVAQSDLSVPEVLAQVVGASEADVRLVPNGKAKAARFVTGRNAYIGTLELDAGGKVPTHRDPTEEYIYVLSGSGTITIDGQQHELGPGSMVLMPAGAEVSYANGPQPFKVVQVFADPGPEKKYDGWPTAAPQERQ